MELCLDKKNGLIEERIGEVLKTHDQQTLHTTDKHFGILFQGLFTIQHTANRHW